MPWQNYVRETNYQHVFRRDAETMLIAFAELKDSDFRAFAQIWKEFKGQLIFSARAYIPNVYRFFFEDAMRVLSEFISGTDYKYYTRIGAIFMYHIMYHSQDSFLKTKVRLTQPNWLSVIELINLAERNGHSHVVHIFQNLMRINAFHFVLLASEEPSTRFYNGVVEPLEHRTNFTHYQTVFSKLRRPEIDMCDYDDIREIDRQYAEAKRSLNVDGVEGLSTVFNIRLLSMQDSETVMRLLESKRRDEEVEMGERKPFYGQGFKINDDTNEVNMIGSFDTPSGAMLPSYCEGEERMKTESSDTTFDRHSSLVGQGWESVNCPVGSTRDCRREQLTRRHLFTVEPGPAAEPKYRSIQEASALTLVDRHPPARDYRSARTLDEIRTNSVFSTIARHQQPKKWGGQKPRQI